MKRKQDHIDEEASGSAMASDARRRRQEVPTQAEQQQQQQIRYYTIQGLQQTLYELSLLRQQGVRPLQPAQSLLSLQIGHPQFHPPQYHPQLIRYLQSLPPQYHPQAVFRHPDQFLASHPLEQRQFIHVPHPHRSMPQHFPNHQQGPQIAPPPLPADRLLLPDLNVSHEDHRQLAESIQRCSNSSNSCLSESLSSDFVMELNNMLDNLSEGWKSVKDVTSWLAQRSSLAPALVEVIRDKIFAIDDSFKQIHILQVVSCILTKSCISEEVSDQALAFKPFLGSILGKIYHNPGLGMEHKSKLKQLLQFWASKRVYDRNTIDTLEAEMMLGGPHPDTPPNK